MRVAIVCAGALIVGAVLLVATETAEVRIVVPAQRVEVVTPLDGLNLLRIQASLTEQSQGTASITTVSAAYASGWERFLLVCITPGPCTAQTVPRGTIVKTAHNIRFTTIAPVTLSGPAGSPSQYGMAPIRAVAAGSSGNQGAGAIEYIENSPRPCCIVVFNPQSTTGGVDAGTVSRITQSDLDSARSALTTEVTGELANALSDKAAGMTYVADSSPSLNFSSDYRVGDKVSTFTLTVNATLGASAFSNDEADPLVIDALASKVPAGYRLDQDIHITYAFVDGPDPGQLRVIADGVGGAIPTESASLIASLIRGRSVADARSSLRAAFAGASVDISTRPLPFPILPILPNRIAVLITSTTG